MKPGVSSKKHVVGDRKEAGNRIVSRQRRNAKRRVDDIQLLTFKTRIFPSKQQPFKTRLLKDDFISIIIIVL